MKGMKGWLAIILPAAALIAGGYFFLTSLASKSFVPEDFSQARVKGADLAREIVSLSESSLESLKQIAAYDQAGDFSKALILVSQEVGKNREAQDKAIKLAAQLEKMAKAITEISPAQGRILATEAVSSEVALVSHLVSYNDFFLQLFEALRAKFTNPKIETDGKIQAFIEKINAEAAAINDFNRRFNQAMAEFDKIYSP